MNSARGFTLIEALVALVIVALAVPAFIKLTVNQADGVFHAKKTVSGQWVANYVIASRKLYQEENSTWNRDSGDVEMFDQKWQWVLRERKTDIDDFNQYFLAIYHSDNEDQVVYEAVYYGR